MPDRTPIPYFNVSAQGEGLEGFLNWSNITMDYWMFPTFLLVIWGLSIYFATKNEWKVGAQIAIYSLFCFALGMMAQTFTLFHQIVMFFFAIGIIVGIVMSFIERNK